MVICLGRGADLHMAQMMPLPLIVSCSSKSRLVLPFWYRLTWVVPGAISNSSNFNDPEGHFASFLSVIFNFVAHRAVPPSAEFLVNIYWTLSLISFFPYFFLLLLPPPKKEVMFLVRSVCLSVCLFVCLSVCPSDYSQTCERILTKFSVGVGHGSRTK